MRSIRALVITIVVVLVIIAIPVVQLVRPVPVPTVTLASTISNSRVPGAAPTFQWPKQGQAAISAVGIGSFGQSGSQASVPIASVTKVMTAYLVLKKHPLALGQQGPSITVTPADVDIYKQDLAKSESVVKVQAGEKLTEREALEGLLLPSGNNIGSLLAKWCDGSEANFVQEMNATAKQMGLTHTHYADATGYSPESRSDAVDQVKLFSRAMENATFRSVVAEAQAYLPVAGLVYNVNSKIGHGTIIGGKTGSTSEAGGCFVFAAQKVVGTKTVLIVGAVLGQMGLQELDTALNDGVVLAKDAQAALRPVQVLRAGDTVGTLNAPWTNQLTLSTNQGVTMVGWPGLEIRETFQPAKLGSTIAAGSTVGTLNVQVGQQTQKLPVRTSQALPAPSLTWRLKRL